MTNDAKKMLYTLYQEYLSRRKAGEDKVHAKSFQNDQSIHDDFFPDWSVSDVRDTLLELEDLGYLYVFYADASVYWCRLENSAISLFENLPGDAIRNLASFIAQFIP